MKYYVYIDALTFSKIVTTFGKFELIDPDVSITRNIVT